MAEIEFPFRRLDNSQEEWNGFDFVLTSVEGPNGVGKTSAYKTAINVLQALCVLTSGDKCSMPVIGVAEPTAIPIDSGRQDTWRSLAKEGISRDGILETADLKDQLFQAYLFLLNRHLVEYAMLNVNEFTISGLLYGFDDIWIRPDRTILNSKDLVLGMDQLADAGALVGFKDRGTGSTIRYQGGEPRVMEIIKRFYKEKFLRKEDLTILITPYSADSLRTTDDARERDQYSDNGDVDAYRSIKNYEGSFTDMVVEIKNDPTGRRGSISTTSVVIATLALMAVKNKSGEINMQKRRTTQRMHAPIIKALQLLEGSGTPGFRDMSRQLIHDRQMSGGIIASGEVEMKLLGDEVEVTID